MMLTARSMLHVRLPRTVFGAQIGKGRSITSGSATSHVACATYDSRSPRPGKGGGERGAPGSPRSEDGTGDQETQRKTSSALPKEAGGVRKQGARGAPSRPSTGRGGSSKGGRQPSQGRGRGRQQIESQDDLASTDPVALLGMIKACGDLASLKELALRYSHLFQNLQVSAMMIRVAKEYNGHNANEAQHVMLQLSAVAEELIDDMSPWQMADILWALGKVGGGKDASFMSKWVVYSNFVLHEFTTWQLANSLWAVATLEGIEECNIRVFTRGWLRVAAWEMNDFYPVDIAKSLWAAATLGIKDEYFITKFLLAAEPKLPCFNAQELADSLWATAKLGIRVESFIASWLLAAQVRLPEFNAQELSNSLWAAATLDIRDESFMSSCLLAAKAKVPEMNSRNVTDIEWAADKLGFGVG